MPTMKEVLETNYPNLDWDECHWYACRYDSNLVLERETFWPHNWPTNVYPTPPTLAQIRTWMGNFTHVIR